MESGYYGGILMFILLSKVKKRNSLQICKFPNMDLFPIHLHELIYIIEERKLYLYLFNHLYLINYFIF